MNKLVQFDDKRSAALRDLLVETATEDRRQGFKRATHPHRRTAFLLATGIVVGAVGTGGAVWASGGSTSQAPSPGASLAFPAYYDQLEQITAAVAALRVEFPDVYAGFWIDEENTTLHLSFFEGADATRVARYVEKVEAIAVAPPLVVAASAVNFDFTARSDLAAEIAGDNEKWSEYFGRDFSAVRFDEGTGEIALFVAKEQSPMHATAPDGTPIVFVVASLEPQ